MNYLKVRNKMIILLVTGVVLAIGTLLLLNSEGKEIYITSFSGLFIVVALICYPLAIVYGHRQIVGIFESIRIGERRPFQTSKMNSLLNPLFSVLNCIVAIVIVLSFGWVYGVYTAYQKLQMMKGFHIK